MSSIFIISFFIAMIFAGLGLLVSVKLAISFGMISFGSTAIFLAYVISTANKK